MRILMVGNGGREHTLLWKLKKDAPTAEFFATQPNGGMAHLAEGVAIPPGDTEALAGWAASRSIDLTVVGPEGPLAAGIADRFRAKGLPVFGPIRRRRPHRVFQGLLQGADAERRRPHGRASESSGSSPRPRSTSGMTGAPIVVKASGLAAGKGAIVCETEDQALQAVREMLADLRFGEAGREVVIEECMQGEELSVFALTDGRSVLTLLPSQDHKRVGEGDTGPNTGGMGAYAPVSLASPPTHERGGGEGPSCRPSGPWRRKELHFQGLLYAGLMLTHEGPKVVEFNCRFGDPETQVVLPLLIQFPPGAHRHHRRRRFGGREEARLALRGGRNHGPGLPGLSREL